MQMWILTQVVLCLTIYSTTGSPGQRCQYPAHSHIRLPGSSKRSYLECESSQVYEEKECPLGTEFDSVSMICVYKMTETSQVPIWNSAEEEEEEAMLNKVASTKPPPPPSAPSTLQPQIIQQPNQQQQIFHQQQLSQFIQHQPQVSQQVPQFNQQSLQTNQQPWQVHQQQFQVGQQQPLLVHLPPPQSGSQQSQTIPQWPNSMPIELFSSCTSDSWCPHDPIKLQYCDVNGESFMQCSAMGWVLKQCPAGSLFTGHMGRCVDPRETPQSVSVSFPQQPIQVQTISTTLSPGSSNNLQFIGGIPNSKIVSFGTSVFNPSSITNFNPSNNLNAQVQSNVVQQPQSQVLVQPRVVSQNTFVMPNSPNVQASQPFSQQQQPPNTSINSNNLQSFIVGSNQQSIPPFNTKTVSNQVGTGGQNVQFGAVSTDLNLPFGGHSSAKVTLPPAVPVTPIWVEWSTTSTSTHAPLVSNYILGGQQSVSLTPEQIAALPRGKLIYIPEAANSSSQQWNVQGSTDGMNGFQPQPSNKIGAISLNQLSSSGRVNANGNDNNLGNPWQAQPWQPPPSSSSSSNQQTWKNPNENIATPQNANVLNQQLLFHHQLHNQQNPSTHSKVTWNMGPSSTQRLLEQKQFPFVSSNTVIGDQLPDNVYFANLISRRKNKMMAKTI